MVFITGTTLSGKSFIANSLSKSLGDVPIFSTGDFYKSLKDSYSERDTSSIQNSDLSIDFEETIREQVIKFFDEVDGKGIVEGFPRSVDQADFIYEKMGAKNNTIFYFSIDENECIRRHRIRPRGKSLDFSISRLRGALNNKKGLIEKLFELGFTVVPLTGEGFL